ncbi:hypothetical protein CANINC_004808 [Pichia inconspicua]|uniref:Uncharacterized protein n=1 Tax=Pichia inconspicua TaxID=52247 RepID=A0A4T0WV61_9ASCO|nr:hypothetical protein CANINC_004808 [[Candida] inconspicua]
MQLSIVLFAASVLAASSTRTEIVYSTEIETITSCDEHVTDCPAKPKKNETESSALPTFSAAAVEAHGTYFAAGAAALAAGALLL